MLWAPGLNVILSMFVSASSKQGPDPGAADLEAGACLSSQAKHEQLHFEQISARALQTDCEHLIKKLVAIGDSGREMSCLACILVAVCSLRTKEAKKSTHRKAV